MIFDNLKSAIRDKRRIESVDYLRGIAILAVVFYHFNKLPYGYLGVDLFFVLSGAGVYS